jgi:hypothetical protein
MVTLLETATYEQLARMLAATEHWVNADLPETTWEEILNSLTMNTKSPSWDVSVWNSLQDIIRYLELGTKT